MSNKHDPKSKPSKATAKKAEATYQFEAEGWTRWEYLFRSGHVFIGLGVVQLFGLIVEGQFNLAMSGLSLGLAIFAIGFGLFLMFKAHKATRNNRRKILRDVMFIVVLVILGILAQNALGLFTIYFFAFGSPVIIWNTSKKLLDAQAQQERIDRKERTLKTIASQSQGKVETKTGELRNMSRAERKRYRETHRNQNTTQPTDTATP